MRQRIGRTPICSATVAVATALLAGCAVFPNMTLRTMEELQRSPTAAVTPQDAIDLELFFIERPPGDPLVGEPLWSELDQIGSLSPDVRARLQQNGIRFGLSGAQPPYALNALITAESDPGYGRSTLRQEYQMPSGVSHLFPCGRLPDPIRLVVHDGPTTREREYHSARGVIRCRVERSQPGWARIEVLPEIHHGQNRMRPQASDQNWDWGGGQEVDPLYGQRFVVELNEGETLVLGPTGTDPDSVGQRLFRTSESADTVEKLLVIRLARIAQVQPRLQTR